jgi:branched-chain amino acid transport system permease protein
MGIGGVLLAGYYGNVDPNTFIIVDNSIEMIAMAVIGGMSSILGPLGGAFLFEIMRESVLGQFFESGALRNLFLFVFVIVVLVLARDGLFRMLWHRLGAVRGDER